MASRPILPPYPVIVNASMASTVTSLVSIISNGGLFGYDVSWSDGSGGTAGTFSVQVSNTAQFNSAGAYVSGSGNWTSLVLSETPTVAAASGNGYIDVTACSASFARLVYTPSGGSGTLNATIAGKGSGS